MAQSGLASGAKAFYAKGAGLGGDKGSAMILCCVLDWGNARVKGTCVAFLDQRAVCVDMVPALSQSIVSDYVIIETRKKSFHI